MAAKTREVDEDKLMTLDRSALLEMVAHDILDRKEVEKGRRVDGNPRGQILARDGVTIGVEEDGIGITE